MKPMLAAAARRLAGPARADPDGTPPPAEDGCSRPPRFRTRRKARATIGAAACRRIGAREVAALRRMPVSSPSRRILGEGRARVGPGARLLDPGQGDGVEPG